MYKRLIDRANTVELELKKVKNKSKIFLKAYNKYFKYEDKIIIETDYLIRFINRVKSLKRLINTDENKKTYYIHEKYEIFFSKMELDIDDSISMYIDFSISINESSADRYVICLSYYEFADIIKFLEKEIEK